MKGPVVAGVNINLLNKDEVAVLARGPGFTIRRVLNRERFRVEAEKSYIKVRWTKKDEDVDNECDLEGISVTEDEQKRITTSPRCRRPSQESSLILMQRR